MEENVVENNDLKVGTGKKCFIITPIGNPGSNIHREAIGIVDHIIKPVCADIGFKIVKSAVDFDTGVITTNIIKSIHEADLIIANITDQNPNVMYELALAHAFQKRVIHILREGSIAPFDIGTHKYHTYTNDFEGFHNLTTVLKRATVAALDEKDDEISNPVVEALKTFTVVDSKVEQYSMDSLVSIVESLSQDFRRFSTQQLYNQNLRSPKVRGIYPSGKEKELLMKSSDYPTFEDLKKYIDAGYSRPELMDMFVEIPDNTKFKIDKYLDYLEKNPKEY